MIRVCIGEYDCQVDLPTKPIVNKWVNEIYFMLDGPTFYGK